MSAVSQFVSQLVVSPLGSWIDHRFLALALDAGVKSALILALAWSATRLMRNRSAAARHLVWCAANVAILMIPLLELALPAWRALPPSMNAGVRFAPLQAMMMHAPDVSSAPQANHPLHSSNRAPNIAMILFVCWAIGAALCLLPIVLGKIQLRLLRHHHRCIQDSDLNHLIEQVRKQLCLRLPTRLYIADEQAMPMTWGILRTKLLLPGDALRWPSIRVRSVVLHELAHAKRLDCLTHLIAQMARAIYWFNPLIWVALRQMRIERERACDDLVIDAGVRRTDYAREILEVCAGRFSRASNALAMPIAGASTIERRIREILDDTQTQGKLTMRHILLAAVVMALFVIPMSILSAADAPGAAPAPATRPSTQPSRIAQLLDFKGREQMKQAAENMRLLLLCSIMYSNDHASVFPADQGEMVPYLRTNANADERAIAFVDPRFPIDVPTDLTADWVNKNSAWTYIGGGMSYEKVKDVTTTIVIHSDMDKPFGDMIVAGFADGHVELIKINLATTAIEESKTRIKNALGAEAGKL